MKKELLGFIAGMIICLFIVASIYTVRTWYKRELPYMITMPFKSDGHFRMNLQDWFRKDHIDSVSMPPERIRYRRIYEDTIVLDDSTAMIFFRLEKRCF